MRPSKRGRWRNVPADPSPADLGYDRIDLDVIETSADGRPRALVLPRNEDLLREDAFLVVDAAGVCDLLTMT